MLIIKMLFKFILMLFFLPLGIVGFFMTISDFDGMNLFLTIMGLGIGIFSVWSLSKDYKQYVIHTIEKKEANRAEEVIPTNADMVASTSTMEAYLEGTKNRLLEHGYDDQVVISEHANLDAEIEKAESFISDAPYKGGIKSLPLEDVEYSTMNKIVVSTKSEHADTSSAAASKPSSDEILSYANSLTEFPLVDEQGMKILRILDDVRLSGVTKEHKGVNPQEVIEELYEGEEVFFQRVKMKKYPHAVLVVNSISEPIGWIPEDFAYQQDIAKRLDDGTTVKGTVSKILGGEDGKNYGITINIARYTKPRVSKC